MKYTLYTVYNLLFLVNVIICTRYLMVVKYSIIYTIYVKFPITSNLCYYKKYCKEHLSISFHISAYFLIF